MTTKKKEELMKTTFIVFIVAFFSVLCFSAIIGTAKVEGTIVSYSKHTVTLSQKGKKVKVPRKAIPTSFKIKTGNYVYAVFDGQAVMADLKKSGSNKPQTPANKSN